MSESHPAVVAAAAPSDLGSKIKSWLGIFAALLAIGGSIVAMAITWSSTSTLAADNDTEIKAIQTKAATRDTDIAVIKSELRGVKKAMEKVDKRTEGLDKLIRERLPPRGSK